MGYDSLGMMMIIISVVVCVSVYVESFLSASRDSVMDAGNRIEGSGFLDFYFMSFLSLYTRASVLCIELYLDIHCEYIYISSE